ncbi:Abi family protein (plasmid) [Clostridium baratii]|uniref:Abi family protein n=1 Tax=Clostridium baratii TaxID=1561 RepID=UPI0030CD0652
MEDAKSINTLMKHMRIKHNIAIGNGVHKGGTHKKDLENIGYYHGYKGYRFIKTKNNVINFNNFNEIVNINKFDMDLKTLIYPKIMFLETSIKNHVLESMFQYTKKPDFESIYNNILISYREIRRNEFRNNQSYQTEYQKRLSKRLKLRTEIYSNLHRNFTNNTCVIQHFYNDNRDVPIWAIFEVITMGTLGNFISNMKKEVRSNLSNSINLNTSEDTDSLFSSKIIYILKDLRNSVAHNNVIFDVRFKSCKISKNFKNAISMDTGIANITFDSIVDYIILIVYLLKGLGETKTELKRFVNRFVNIIEEFRKNINISYYNRIIPTDTRNKLSNLNIFISR